MFILRKLTPEFSTPNSYKEYNELIGNSYNLIHNHNESFDFIVKDYDNSEDQIYAFLVYDSGSKVVPLYKGMQNYIMTTNGQTFDNLTFK